MLDQLKAKVAELEAELAAEGKRHKAEVNRLKADLRSHRKALKALGGEAGQVPLEIGRQEEPQHPSLS